jgi:hypothetical protein
LWSAAGAATAGIVVTARTQTTTTITDETDEDIVCFGVATNG